MATKVTPEKTEPKAKAPKITKEQAQTAAKLRDEGKGWNAIRDDYHGEPGKSSPGSTQFFDAFRFYGIEHRAAKAPKPAAAKATKAKATKPKTSKKLVIKKTTAQPHHEAEHEVGNGLKEVPTGYTATVRPAGKNFLHKVFLDGNEVSQRRSPTPYAFVTKNKVSGFSYSTKKGDIRIEEAK